MSEQQGDAFDPDIDYLHPDGKPLTESVSVGDKDDAKPSERNLRKAIEEADGHYMPKDDPFLR